VTVVKIGTSPANVDRARRFADWLLSPDGQASIASFTIEGKVAFGPVQ